MPHEQITGTNLGGQKVERGSRMQLTPALGQMRPPRA